MHKKTNNKIEQDKALFTEEFFRDDDIRAVDAKTRAQEIAFAPMTFQAIRSMLELGLLQMIEDAGDSGISGKELAEKSGVSLYGVNLLCEMALGMKVIRLSDDSSFESDERYVLGKTGWMLLEDDLTKANFWFTNDICYQGAWDLLASIKSGKPEGLKVFGDKWTTIYEALSSLPERAKKSWFDFDHFYSDIAFPDALPIVFAKKPCHLVDIGGNTAKWAISCCKYDQKVHLTIMDLPGQTAVAEKNAAAAGFADRISTRAGNILDESDLLPQSADAVWMSQFLDCFSLHQITKIAKKIYSCIDEKCRVYVLEPLWDKQKFMASSYSLQATSLYFTCMANGNSKMYRYAELVQAIEESGLKLKVAHHNLGSNNYTLLEFTKQENK